MSHIAASDLGLLCSRNTPKNGWMDDFRFYVLFNNISVISGRLEVDNKRMCAMEPHLQLILAARGYRSRDR